MQEVQAIGGITGGGRVIGDRRMRHHLHHQQALKCPRCDSLNTKFCYYNNYNLSQPRHFCKNCRRYWTNGGVLRNVPVGGGCRKSKRSKPKPKPSPSLSPSPLPSVKPPNSLSSSESSTTTTAVAASASVADGGGGGGVFQISESENFGMNVGLMDCSHQNHNQIGDDHQMMFSSEIGGFPNLMRSSGDPLGYSQFMQSEGGKMMDPTVRMEDLMENRGSDGGLDSLDWQTGGGGAGFFDLLPPPSSGVDQQQSYWSQTTSSSSHQQHHLLSQWSDHANSDLSLFLP